MIFERIFGLAMVALGLLIWYLAHRTDDEVEASVNRALGPVVPLDDLLHEQDSAEAYDDLPDMDVVMAERAAANERTLDHVRDEWVREWNAVFAIDFDGGAR
jgi:hypothetical protein